MKFVTIIEEIICPECEGQGSANAPNECPRCEGEGMDLEEKTISLIELKKELEKIAL